MVRKTHLGEIMETCCEHCQSRFRITQKQLQQAYGKARCNECGKVFNTLLSIKTFEGKLPENYHLNREVRQNANFESVALETPQREEPELGIDDNTNELSLHEAMYGSEKSSFSQFSPLLWFIGILLLFTVGIAQAIYYQRYELVNKPRFQQQVLQICDYLPCRAESFSSIRQIKLLERNVFTHPVETGVLMVSGSFVNQAPFPQKLPDLLVSLFDLQGELIANRSFKPDEYLYQDENFTSMGSGKSVQFRLEVIDPGTSALTYEFEFL